MRHDMHRLRIAVIVVTIMSLQSDLGYSQEQFSDRQIDSLAKYGIQLYSEGKYKEAIAVLDSIVDSAPGSLVKYYLGLSYSAVNKIDIGLIHLGSAVRRDSLNIGYRFQYARNLALSGDTRNAQTQYEMIIKLDSAYIPAYFQLGVLLCDSKAYQQAGEVFERLHRLNPHDFLTDYYLGIIHIALSDNKSAFPYLSRCVSLNSRYIPGLSALASLYFADSEYAGSLRLYLRAIELQPDNPEFYHKASVTFCKMKKNDSAFVYSRKAVEFDSSNSTFQAQYGYTALLTEHYEIARDAYQKAIAKEPTEPTYYINLALAYTKLDSTENTIRAYRRAIQEYHPESIGMVHYRLGSLFYTIKKYRQAAVECRKAIDLDPRNSDAYFYLALAYDRLKDKKNAIRNYGLYIEQAHLDSVHIDNEQLKQARARLDFLKKSK